MGIKKAKPKAATKAKAKVANAKAKIKSKIGKTAAIVFAILMICGCATSDPASRQTTARYGDIVIKIEDGSYNNKVELHIGDGAIASADSSGSTETMTSSPTNDVKPDIDVSVPVNKAGAAQSVGSVLGDAVASLITGTAKTSSGTTATAETASSAASSLCTDGSCSVSGACTDGSCYK